MEILFLHYNKIKNSDDLYISHVVYQMMLSGVKFKKSAVKEYIDWGTLKEWNMYKSQYSTLFINIDGVLVEKSHEFFEPNYGNTTKIKDNVAAINSLYDSERVQIILITSRGEGYREITESQLDREGIKYHQIIFNLNRGKKIVINDYSQENPFKSCDAINIKSDSADLKEMLEESLG